MDHNFHYVDPETYKYVGGDDVAICDNVFSKNNNDVVKMVIQITDNVVPVGGYDRWELLTFFFLHM